MSVIVTFCVKEEVYHVTLLGQAQLYLRDIVDFEEKRTFTMNVIDKIKVRFRVLEFTCQQDFDSESIMNDRFVLNF